MKVIQRYEAEDGSTFETEGECRNHEDQLPFVRLLEDVESAVKADAAFAAKIEALGTRLARERRERGEMRRERKPKDEPARVITGPAASADIRADEGRGDARSVIEIIESLKDATSEGEAA